MYKVVKADDYLKYVAAREIAQKQANETGFDYGVEKNAFGYSVFMLPMKKNRSGRELSCEVVSTELGNCKPGHGFAR